jgi:zinc protease
MGLTTNGFASAVLLALVACRQDQPVDAPVATPSAPGAGPDAARAAAAASLPPPPGHDGRITGQQKSARGVVSATFSNGLAVRVLAMDLPDERVIVAARVQRIEGEPTAAAGPLEEALSRALDQPRTAEHGTQVVQQLLNQHGIHLAASAGTEALGLRMVSRPRALGASLQLLFHLLGSARLDPAAWKEATAWAAQREKVRQLSPPHQLDLATRKLLGLARAADEQPPALAAGQEVLDRALRGGRIEVAVVGELEVESMLAQALAALGGLPARSTEKPRPAADPGAAYRGPQRAQVTVVNGPKSVAVRVGWLVPPAGQLADHRALQAGARILTGRLQKELRDRRKLAFTTEATVATVPGSTLSWLGTTVRVQPDNVDVASSTVRDLFQRFAARGPTPDEVKEVRSAIATEVTRLQGSPDHWARVLVGVDGRGGSLAEIDRAFDPAAPVTASAIRTVAARAIRDTRRFEIVGRPAPGEPAAIGPH